MGLVADFVDEHLETVLLVERYGTAVGIDGEETTCRLRLLSYEHLFDASHEARADAIILMGE